MIKTKGVVSIPNCGLYAKSPRALKDLINELEEKGYEVKDCSKENNRPSREEQEKNGWDLWYASLRDDVCEHKGKCDSCGSYIDVRGIRSHKHKCEVCGAYTYLGLVNGSIIDFYFTNDLSDKEEALPSDIKMKVFDYDEKSACLLLYSKPLDGDNWKTMNSKCAQRVLNANRKQFRQLPVRLSCGVRKHIRHLKSQGKYKEVKAIQSRKENQRFGKSLIAIPYKFFQAGVINTTDLSGQKSNHQIVKLFNGEEYDEIFGQLPISESFSIYEAWHWSPMKPSNKMHEKIIHAAGMVSRCDYYYQDGRRAFYDIHLKRMRLFVEHFTTIDVEEWDQIIYAAPKSGPGMIKAIASFCQGVEFNEAKVRSNPNAFGAALALVDVFSGKGITENGLEIIANTIKNPKEGKLLFNIFNRVKR